MTKCEVNMSYTAEVFFILSHPVICNVMRWFTHSGHVHWSIKHTTSNQSLIGSENSPECEEQIKTYFTTWRFYYKNSREKTSIYLNVFDEIRASCLRKVPCFPWQQRRNTSLWKVLHLFTFVKTFFLDKAAAFYHNLTEFNSFKRKGGGGITTQLWCRRSTRFVFGPWWWWLCKDKKHNKPSAV